MTSSPQYDTSRIRILVVDNHEMSRKMLSRMLATRGYRVVAATGIGQSLIDDALAKAQACWPHIAIVDLRIAFAGENDDQHPDDLTGLTLIDQLGDSAHCILLSAWLTPKISRDALKKHGVFDVVGRNNEVVGELLSTLAAAAGEKSAGGRTITFTWNKVMLAGIRRHMGNRADLDLRELIEDMLVQLFPDATNLIIDPVVTGTGSASAQRQHSVVLVVRTAPDRMPIIVKFGPAPRMARERERYQQHVQSQLPLFYAELQKHTSFWGTRCNSLLFPRPRRRRQPAPLVGGLFSTE